MGRRFNHIIAPNKPNKQLDGKGRFVDVDPANMPFTPAGNITETTVQKAIEQVDKIKYGQYDSPIFRHVRHLFDTARAFFGAADDMSIHYDGTKGNIKTGLVNPSDLEIDCGANKTLVLAQTVWEDLNYDPASSGGPAVSLPDYVTINNVVHREFTSANNQLCAKVEECPHKGKLSATYYPHIHVFLKSGETEGTTGVTFTVYWELRQAGGVTSGSVPLTATSAQLLANPVILKINDNTGFAGPTTLAGQLALTLARTGGDAGDVVVTTYGVHYPIDTYGSRQVGTK